MKHTSIKFVLLLVTLVLLPLNKLYAWNALGHMVAANIAYKHLEPNVREKVDSLVREIQKEYPEMSTFQHLAFWPDSLRSQRIETFTHWHYTDNPLSLDGTPTQNLIDTDNGVWAVNQIVNVVRNAKANPVERARFLAFLTHIVADLHQPLHTTMLFSARHLDGDRGGNLYMVRYNRERINMHKLWDSGLGTFDGDSIISRSDSVTSAIESAYPATYFGDKLNDLTPEGWAKEGMENAKNSVYNTPEEQDLSPAYIANGKQVAQQQAALAGYRLAALLNQLLR